MCSVKAWLLVLKDTRPRLSLAQAPYLRSEWQARHRMHSRRDKRDQRQAVDCLIMVLCRQRCQVQSQKVAKNRSAGDRCSQMLQCKGVSWSAGRICHSHRPGPQACCTLRCELTSRSRWSQRGLHVTRPNDIRVRICQ